MSIITSYLKKIAEINAPDILKSGSNTGEWIFHHGMLFLSPLTWWQDKALSGKRKTLHEGIDILFYKDKNKLIQKLNTQTLIPAASDGEVINICDDFIGKSIIVKDNISRKQKLDLLFIYAHIKPEKNVKKGTNLKKGEIIAKIAQTDRNKTLLPPHLHFSVIEVSKTISVEELGWEFFSDKNKEVNIINPLFI